MEHLLSRRSFQGKRYILPQEIPQVIVPCKPVYASVCLHFDTNVHLAFRFLSYREKEVFLRVISRGIRACFMRVVKKLARVLILRYHAF